MAGPILCRSLAVWMGISALVGCTDPPAATEGPVFDHEVSGGAMPWTHERFDATGDKFTFAVFSDLTGGERPRIFEIAVAQLNLLRPELIINVGDLIEGGTQDLTDVDAQWNSFDQRAKQATAPVFYVGGNHDLTGDVLQGVWDQRYGHRYYHFVYKNTLFLVLDTEDNTPERVQEIFEMRNHALEVIQDEGMVAFENTEYANIPEQSAGNIGAQQSRYFQRVITANPDVLWTFLFMHKAAWQSPGEENFAAIENALSNRPYTVFNGHVHAYEYLERLGRDYIRLATTGGSQIPERGRSMDHFLIVTVDESGVDIANLLMEGVLDKTGRLPLSGDDVCFELAICNEQE